MTLNISGKKPRGRNASGAEDVGTFLASLDHPYKQEILAVRQSILCADPGIAEGIKWNAPSFRTSEYFATFHLRAREGVQVILHLGAKKRKEPLPGGTIADPESLLEWHGTDRASVRFRDMEDLIVKQPAFVHIIRQWIRHV